MCVCIYSPVHMLAPCCLDCPGIEPVTNCVRKLLCQFALCSCSTFCQHRTESTGLK